MHIKSLTFINYQLTIIVRPTSPWAQFQPLGRAGCWRNLTTPKVSGWSASGHAMATCQRSHGQGCFVTTNDGVTGVFSLWSMVTTLVNGLGEFTTTGEWLLDQERFMLFHELNDVYDQEVMVNWWLMIRSSCYFMMMLNDVYDRWCFKFWSSNSA